MKRTERFQAWYWGDNWFGVHSTEDILYIVGAAEEAGGAGLSGVLYPHHHARHGARDFTAFTGLGFGLFATMTSGWRWAMPWLGLGAAMIAHAGRNLFSSFLTLDGFGVVMVLLLHALVMLMFFGLLIGMAIGIANECGPGWEAWWAC